MQAFLSFSLYYPLGIFNSVNHTKRDRILNLKTKNHDQFVNIHIVDIESYWTFILFILILSIHI